MQIILLAEGQEASFARIASVPSLNSYDGPNLQHLKQIARLPMQDREFVFQAFADNVRFNMSKIDRLEIAKICEELKLGRVAVN